MWPGTPREPKVGSAPTCRSLMRGQSPGKIRQGRVGLLHLLLDHTAEREQPLVNRGGHLAHEFDHALPVLENSRLPDQLIAELVDLGLVGWRCALQRLQCERVGPDL